VVIRTSNREPGNSAEEDYYRTPPCLSIRKHGILMLRMHSSPPTAVTRQCDTRLGHHYRQRSRSIYPQNLSPKNAPTASKDPNSNCMSHDPSEALSTQGYPHGSTRDALWSARPAQKTPFSSLCAKILERDSCRSRHSAVRTQSLPFQGKS
jgi:hypothetical protein